MKRNERDWAGQLISWILEDIRKGKTIFQHATNDTGIKLETGKTKFPDILLFSDKTSGVIFNGWELKFPDTSVDDRTMLENALEKAQRINSDSFVTWNGSEAVIWKIKDSSYSLDALSIIKEYPKEPSINTREDLADPNNFNSNEHLLRQRASQILDDLSNLFLRGELRHAIDVTGNIIQSVRKASLIILPQFKDGVIYEKGNNALFRDEFNKWKIYESSTLKILSSSSRQRDVIIEEEVLARFIFYNLIGKILFYLTLAENLKGRLSRIDIKDCSNLKNDLNGYFDNAKSIDYQAVFKPYFTDSLPYTPIVNETLFKLINVFNEFDFRILPTDVIGTILENLVPKSEKLKFGQYFTSEVLANLVTFPAIQKSTDIVYDPTSGTGTFLNSYYNILKYHGRKGHSDLLAQIWGNDISHFPAILSVINLYKQDLTNVDNFPRITRDDFFNLEVGNLIKFPDSKEYTRQIELPIPLFDSIASNFPFIQQEDIPNEKLTVFFRGKFENSQRAFLGDSSFKINERSDYFTYCFYNSFRFLKNDGFLSAITSNAWLGKEYGIQFKKFLIDNFQIKYIVKSIAEHWFSDSKVSTIFIVLQKSKKIVDTKFVTINFKLEEQFDKDDKNKQLKDIENFYSEIDNCDFIGNKKWTKDENFQKVYHKLDETMSVSIVPRDKLEASLINKDNWTEFFISGDLFEKFDSISKVLYPSVFKPFRGERTGWNPMFIIPYNKIEESGIETNFLVPYIKSPTELKSLEFSNEYQYFVFVCNESIDKLRDYYPGAYNWIKRFEQSRNKNGGRTIQEALENNRPYWYSLQPKLANIVTAINPYERFFFSFSNIPFCVDQRLVAININDKYDIRLIAALLNSVLTFLTIEMKGTSRNLGALDLNANYFKQLKVLNPNKLKKDDISAIISAFEPLSKRSIGNIFQEVKMSDRRNFDMTVLRCFGMNETIVDTLYRTLVNEVNIRITMKDK